ncbi:glycosyltransferase family 4 protein [Clostridium isatidis]|uniref:glycosyltransferase family 4 protein n=1 Tax=Clostridium isatidis TaxID=182773 RepID=UPI003AAD4F18
MKIGIDGRAAKWYRGTGIGTYTYQLINSLNKIDRINDYLVFLPENTALDLGDNFHIQSVKANSDSNFWDEVKVENSFYNKNLDIYHVPQNGVGLSKNLDCYKTITLHDIIPLRMPETVSNSYLHIFNNEIPKILDNCDGIITVSEFSKQDIAKGFNFPLNKIFVTHLAAEDIYRPLNKKKCKEIIKKEYGIKEEFILYVGGFSPRKNITGLIEAYSLLSKNRRKNLKLIITGRKGISYEIYKNRAIRLNVENDVIFTDFIPLEKLPIFYNASSLLAYPSFYEGFGLPPLEAMACGTPVIASNVTSLPEICGDSALLIDPHNINELSNSIEKVLVDQNLRDKLILKGLEKSSSYSWNITAKGTLEAYKNIIKY